MKTLETNDTSSESEEGADTAICRVEAEAPWSRVPVAPASWVQWPSTPGVSVIGFYTLCVCLFSCHLLMS